MRKCKERLMEQTKMFPGVDIVSPQQVREWAQLGENARVNPQLSPAHYRSLGCWVLSPMSGYSASCDPFRRPTTHLNRLRLWELTQQTNLDTPFKTWFPIYLPTEPLNKIKKPLWRRMLFVSGIDIFHSADFSVEIRRWPHCALTLLTESTCLQICCCFSNLVHFHVLVSGTCGLVLPRSSLLLLLTGHC